MAKDRLRSLHLLRECLKSFQTPLLLYRSPLAPLKKGGNSLKVPLFKGDLGGSQD